MSRFVAIRLAQALIVLVAMSFAVYALIGLMPGDPIDIMVAGNPQLTSEDAARLRAVYGLDRPLLERYGAWIGAALEGDFGYSRVYGVPVLDVLVPRLGNTLILIGISLVLSLALALPIGVLAAVRPYSWVDTAVNLLCFAGISVPSFWLALLLIMLFSVSLGWLPAGLSTAEGGDLIDRLRHLALPVLTLTLASVAGYTRYIRAAMLEQLRQDYTRTARAKGVGRSGLLWRHALPNALIPLITVAALDLGALFSGALITETMFGYLGMGKLIYDSILGNDYNLALVGLLFATVTTLGGNFGADVAYAALDPRISFRSERL